MELIVEKAPTMAYGGHGDHPGLRGSATQLKDIKKQLQLRVLSAEDWHQWTTQGYVVVKNAVPQDKLDAVVNMLWEFQEMDPNDQSTWYQPQRRDIAMKELNGTGMVEVYNHQSLWDTRQEQRVYDAFVDIWDREDLWVALDRANLNPPNAAARESGKVNGFIHFDVDPSARPLPVSVQGILSLKKQGGEIGGFQCVPSVFSEIDDWSSKQPVDANPFKPDVTGHDIINVELEAGDLLIFNSLLAHGVRPNRSKDSVRMAQYISMFPADFENEALRQERIRIFRDQAHPIGDPFPGDPREFERNNYERAKLGSLGVKLLGLEPWQ